MKPRDPELDEMLDALRAEEPTPGEIRRWRSAIVARRRAVRPPVWTALAASIAGVVLGGTVTWKALRPAEPCADAEGPRIATASAVDATFELTYVKLD